eukprot:362353-Chlamydomonas_euryale.AAC.6
MDGRGRRTEKMTGVGWQQGGFKVSTELSPPVDEPLPAVAGIDGDRASKVAQAGCCGGVVTGEMGCGLWSVWGGGCWEAAGVWGRGILGSCTGVGSGGGMFGRGVWGAGGCA